MSFIRHLEYIQNLSFSSSANVAESSKNFPFLGHLIRSELLPFIEDEISHRI